jgi:hypothetical protein
MDTTSWKKIKDEIYGKIGTKRRNKLEREAEYFRQKLLSKQAECNQKQH